jgi:hypothetical protein
MFQARVGGTRRAATSGARDDAGAKETVSGLACEEFRRLTLRSATGWSQRDQPYHDYLKTRPNV